MIHRAFFMLVALSTCLPVKALAYTDKALIVSEVRQYLHGLYLNHYSEQQLREKVQFTVSNLDNRLRLAECDQPLEQQLNANSALASQVTVKVSCNGSSPWSIYVPVKVDVFAQVAVASRNLSRGKSLSADDIRFARVNVAQSGPGYFEVPDDLIGMELKRSLRAGETLSRSMIRPPMVVKRGDAVSLEASIAGIQVVTMGEALANGHVGQRIRVRNARSRRIIDAEIIGPGRVQASM